MGRAFGTIALTAALNGFGIASQAQTCIVDWNNVHQRIDGFGASSAWQSSWTSTEANIFFSTNNGIIYFDTIGNKTTNNGIGLSLLRNHIAYAGAPSSSATPTTVETIIMQDAQALGAKVWSTPWTPAAGFKSTNDIYDPGEATGGGINGGLSPQGRVCTIVTQRTCMGKSRLPEPWQNRVSTIDHDEGVTFFRVCIRKSRFDRARNRTGRIFRELFGYR